MRLTPFTLVLFFISINVSLYVINETGVITMQGTETIQPYVSPTEISGILVYVDATSILMAGTALVVGTILSWLTSNIWVGGTLAVILFALDLLFPIVRWILFGFPVFLGQIGVHASIIVSLTALMSAVWFWFVLGFIGQRNLETT
jgi:hypothetical protein